MHIARLVHHRHESNTMETPRRIVLLNSLYFLLLMKVIKFMTTFSTSYPIRYVITAYIIIINHRLYLNPKDKPEEYVPYTVQVLKVS